MSALPHAGQPPADDAPHILVVDDDARIRGLLQRFLGGHGYRVTAAADAAEARQKLDSLAFDLLVLDVMMPGEDGFSLAEGLKARSEDPPILLLTAKTEGADRVRGLETGADDYLAKPFEPRELLLRIGNMLRRRAPAPEPRGEVRFGRFTFDLKREELLADGEPVRLTERERQLLALFAGAPDGTVSREALVGSDGAIGDRAVDVQVNRLRRKIEDDPANPSHLITVRGTGYRLRMD
jgi:two-component system phosphate regulon response regulator OmpR